MLLGKRPRPPMKRTTSITEFTLDLSNIEAPLPSPNGPHERGQSMSQDGFFGSLSSPSPRNYRRNSADFVGTAHFLRACGLCERQLMSGKDIYMYKGETAFCSSECRQQQILQDERKEKCAMASNKEGNTTAGVVGSESSNNNGTVAAA